ncbi:MAG: ATP-binding protein [Bacteroidales bacterium]
MRELKITKQTAEDKPKRLSKKQVQELNLIGHIEQVVAQSKDSKLSGTFYRNIKPHTDYIGQMLELTPVQAMLISLFINNSDNKRIELKDLSNYVGCTHIAMIGLINDIDVLVSKKYIRSRQRDDVHQFSVPNEFIDAIRKEAPYAPTQYTNLDTDSVFVAIEEILRLRDDEECSFQSLIEDLTFIVENNKQVTFCRKVNKYRYDDNLFVILTAFCSLLVNDDDNMVSFHYFIDLLDDKREQRRIKRGMQNGTYSLMKDNLDFIECTNNNGLEDHEYYKLTNKACEELLSDYQLNKTNIKSQKEFLLHTSLAEKSLFYNEHETAQISQLESLLQQENFQTIQKRLQDGGLRKGFACLFYGSPGTGKTETVYQIARRTGRDIMVVNVAQIKSAWVGESEKNIKALFDRYRQYCKNQEIMPILLFNEADAVLGVRQEGAERAVDKMENSIQNIILQEMESLDGIMIATTNLTQNLDKAFERRFLYKIEFSKPSIQAKQAIWKTMLPMLSDHEADDLAHNYQFSGGQIENIARKSAVDVIINGVKPSIDTIHSYCQSEQLHKSTERKRIGY